MIHITENQNNTLLPEIPKNEDDNKLFITFPEQHASSESLEVINSVTTANWVHSILEYNHISMLIENFVPENCEKKL